jgi:hypothetical protein
MSGKQLPPPAEGDRLTALLRARHVQPDDTPAPAPQTAVKSATEAPQRPARVKGPAMDRRSWYMPRESADALAAAVEEMHFATRRPKHVIVAALVAVALDHLDEVRTEVEH